MLRTLLVEDDQRFRETLKGGLKEWFPSMVVEEANDGREAMEKVESLCPTLAFMDIRLPDESGLNVTEKIRGKCPDITIVMMTSYDIPEYQEAAMQRGASHYFVKGTTSPSEIKTWVESFLCNSKKTTTTEKE